MLCRSTVFYRARDFIADLTCDYEENCVLMHFALKPITLTVITQKEEKSVQIPRHEAVAVCRYVGRNAGSREM
jgi:hypothetical protein